jgi:Arc/MetJ family transcription regulator
MARKKTALLVDPELVERCRALLGTSTTSETIEEAMREVIRVQGRARHFERLRRRELQRGGHAPG